MSTTLTELRDILQHTFSLIPSDQQLIILLDSLDQLQITDLQNLSIWLPRIYPSANVKCILSTIPEIEYERKMIDIHGLLKSLFDSDMIELKVPLLNEFLARQILDAWLDEDRRCLTPIQLDWLKSKLSSSYFLTPLFLSLIYDQTLSWHSFDTEPDQTFLAIKSTRDAIGYLYTQLGKKYGQVLFTRSMRYLQLSGGLSELELEDILSLDNTVLQSVYAHYLPPFGLFRLPSTLWIRIRNDMYKYLIEKEIDNVPCIYL
ncbi:unnamed protein product [Rotaria sp. Silwood1]|nr:unnamed protein product [Rotaria sp. Silwood1]